MDKALIGAVIQFIGLFTAIISITVFVTESKILSDDVKVLMIVSGIILFTTGFSMFLYYKTTEIKEKIKHE